MPWQEIAERIPAFAALCILVLFAGKHIRLITDRYMKAMEQYMVQVRELSATCHSSHREVADRMGGALRDNTVSLNGLRETQHDTTVAITQMNTLLKHVNGKLSR